MKIMNCIDFEMSMVNSTHLFQVLKEDLGNNFEGMPEAESALVNTQFRVFRLLCVLCVAYNCFMSAHKMITQLPVVFFLCVICVAYHCFLFVKYVMEKWKERKELAQIVKVLNEVYILIILKQYFPELRRAKKRMDYLKNFSNSSRTRLLRKKSKNELKAIRLYLQEIENFDEYYCGVEKSEELKRLWNNVKKDVLLLKAQVEEIHQIQDSIHERNRASLKILEQTEERKYVTSVPPPWAAATIMPPMMDTYDTQILKCQMKHKMRWRRKKKP